MDNRGLERYEWSFKLRARLNEVSVDSEDHSKKGCFVRCVDVMVVYLDIRLILNS